MKAREVMTAHPLVVTADEPVGRAAQIMARKDIGLVPVVEDTQGLRVTGVITDRDLAVRHVAAGHGPDCLVADHMTGGPLDVVHPDDDIHEVADRMARDQVRRVLVVEDGLRLVGIIAQADVVRALGPREPRLVEKVLERISEPLEKVVA